MKKNVRIIKIHGNGNKSDNTRPVVRRAADAFRYCHFITEMASTDYDIQEIVLNVFLLQQF